uniref:Uncharacterized protein n=1 Tax=Romanomermis culicivorax TaxID=13658 RepID=A0A915INM0_ROMCU
MNRALSFFKIYFRHFYPELMDMANKQAAQDHESIWKFDAKSSNIRMNWPIIGDFSATTVVALNLIILKF